MAQVSYGSITIIDTNDIERIYTVYAKSNSNIEIPLIEVQNWSESITLAPGEGDYIWQRTVVQKTSIEAKSYSEPVCLTGSSGQSVDSISIYYCNYSNGRPEEDYEGWQSEIPQYDEDKPYYWIKTVIIFTDSTKKTIVESGEIISVNLTQESCCKSLKVDIEPIQDLHGYDKPWSGGNGKNKADCADISAPSTSNTTYNVALGSASYVVSFDIVNAVRENLSNTSFLNIVSSGANNYFTGETILKVSDNSTLNSAGANINGRYYCTVSNKAIDSLVFLWRSNSYATLSSGAVKNIMVEVGTTPSAYEPYSNICPISGRTEVVTSRCGVNVWDEEWEVGALDINTGASVYSLNRIRPKNFIPCLPDTAYSFYYPPRASVSTGNIRVFYYDENKTFISYKNWMVDGTFTTPSGTRYMKFYTNGSYGETYQNDISINYPSTDTDYHAYNGTQYTTDLGRTVYGGTLDVVSGVLTVTHGIVDMGTLVWTRSTAFGGSFIADLLTMKANTAQSICSAYPIVSSGSEMTSADYAVYTKNNGQTVYAKSASFKTTVSGVQLCYELATPQTIQLTPQEVELLKGQNNIWNDAGDIEANIITISNRDVIIRQDNGITEAVAQSVEANANAATALSISQHASEDSQGAMAQAASNVSEIKRIWYAQSAATPTPAAPTTGITTTAAHDAWSITKPAPNNDYQYYFYCDQTKTGGGVYSWSEVILDTSNLSQYQIGALTSKVKNFWWDSSGAHVASGKNGNEVTTNTISTYGYHALMGLTGINFNYDGAKVVDLNSTTPSLDFYQPPTISGSTVTQGKKTMMLSANALKFYDPTNGTTEQAVLDSNGLLLKEGGVKSGSVNAGNSGFVYLSTKNYGSNLTINGHQASNWREVIGTKFGVDADGNLYASNADISGKITVGEGSNVSTTTEMNTAIGKAVDDIEIGGRNLFGYGSQCESLGGFDCFGAWDITTEDGFTCAHAAGVLTTTKYLRSKISFTPKPLEIMTFSLNVKIKNIVYGTTNPMCELYFSGQTIDGTWRAWNVLAVYIDGVKYEGSITNIRFPTYISDTKWHHFAVVARAVDANFTSNLAPSIYLRDATGDLYVRNIKYERGNKATDWSPAPEDTPKQLGVNMLRGTASMGVGSRYYNYGHWRPSGGTATNIKFTVAPPVTGLTHLIRVTNTGSAANQIGLAQDRIPGAMINANYTISCWVRLSTPGWVYIRAFYYDGNTYSTASNDFYIGTSWQHISWTGTLTGTQYNQYSGGYIYFKNAPVNAYMDVCGIKVEEGIIPTDWCPAPSDNGLLRKIPFTSFNKEANITLSPNSAGTTLTITYTGSATTAHYGGYVDIPCEPNTTYDVGFYMSPTGQWYFSSGSDGSSSNWTGLLGYQTLPTSAYRTCYRIITGASDTYFRLYFSTQAASTSLYIDDLTIVSCDMTMASQLATAYITDIDSKKGITIKPADSSGNDYLQMNSTDIRFVKSNTARMVLAATDLSFYDSGGQRRLLLNSSSGLLCGRTDRAYTQVTDGGLYIINGTSTQTNKKLAQVTADGLEVFDSADGSSAAIFGATARIGKPSGASRLELDYHSMKLIDTESKPYFQISDLRNQSGVATITDYWIGNASDKTFTLSFTATNTSYTVKVNGTAVTSGITKASNSITFTNAPAKGATITATFNTTNSNTKAYTIGIRHSSGTIGAFSVAAGYNLKAQGSYSFAEGWLGNAEGTASHAEGYATTSSNIASHAEGRETTASGVSSHAEGTGSVASAYDSHAEGNQTQAQGSSSHSEGSGTIASGGWSHAEGMATEATGHGSHAGGRGTIANGNNQTAIGQYNVAHSSHLFIIGKGTSSERANAFHITNTGAVYVNGTSVHSSDRRLKEHISYIGDEAIEFIDGLKPAHYIKEGEKHVGFYAQDVAEVDKWDCMIGEEMNGYMTLGYMELFAPMVTYIQKLEKRVKELEAKLK